MPETVYGVKWAFVQLWSKKIHFTKLGWFAVILSVKVWFEVACKSLPYQLNQCLTNQWDTYSFNNDIYISVYVSEYCSTVAFWFKWLYFNQNVAKLVCSLDTWNILRKYCPYTNTALINVVTCNMSLIKQIWSCWLMVLTNGKNYY